MFQKSLIIFFLLITTSRQVFGQSSCPIVNLQNSSATVPLRLKSFSYTNNLALMSAVIEGPNVLNRSDIHMWVGANMPMINPIVSIQDMENRTMSQGSVNNLIDYNISIWYDDFNNFYDPISSSTGPYNFKIKTLFKVSPTRLSVYVYEDAQHTPESVTLKSESGKVLGVTSTRTYYNSFSSVFTINLNANLPTNDTWIVMVNKTTQWQAIITRIELWYDSPQPQCGWTMYGWPMYAGPMYGGSNMTSWFDENTCKWNYNLTGSFFNCREWSSTVDSRNPNMIHMKNKLYAEWTDLLDNNNVTRYQKVSFDLRIDADRDVVTQAQAPLTIGDMTLKIPSVVYTPPSGSVLAYVTVNWILEAPCPIAPSLYDAGVSLRVDEAGNLADYSTDTLSFTQTSSPNCANFARLTTVTGTVSFNLTSGVCWADGTYVLMFDAGNNSTLFTQNFTISDNFNFCSATNLDATVTATIDVYGGINPRKLQDPVMFYGNLSSTGLPMNSVRLIQATVANRRPSYGSTYTHPIYTSNTGSTLTTFGRDTRFAGAWKYPTDNPTWTNSLDVIGLNPATYPANVGSLPYTVQVTPFGGSSLSSSYMIQDEYGATDLAFGIKLEWRVYFSLQERGMGRRKYLLEKREAIDIQMAKDTTVEFSRVPFQASNSAGTVFTANVSTGPSTGMIVGIAVGGVILVAAIVTVGVLVAKRRKQQVTPISPKSDKKFKMLA